MGLSPLPWTLTIYQSHPCDTQVKSVQNQSLPQAMTFCNPEPTDQPCSHINSRLCGLTTGAHPSCTQTRKWGLYTHPQQETSSKIAQRKLYFSIYLVTQIFLGVHSKP